MSTPQGPGQSPDQAPEWGQPPAGGWGGAQGQQQPNPDDERTQRVTPDALDQAKQQYGGQPPAGQQPAQPGWGQPGQQYGGQPPAQQWGGYQQGGGQQGGQYGQAQPTQGYPGQPPGWDQGAQQGWGQPGAAQPGQYGQPDQYGQPAWGGQQQGQQGWGGPATQQWQGDQQQWGAGQGYPPPLPDAQKRSGGSKLPWIIVAVVVVVLAAVGVLGFVTPGFFVTKVFDATAVQQGVTKILNDNYQVNASAVSCPANVKVTSGATFQCDATIDGAQKKVPITITSGSGDYQVGRPA